MKPFFVYILASQRNGALYIGMTDDLEKRVWQHRTGAIPGFTQKYGVKLLVWFEQHGYAGGRLRARASGEEMESRVEAAADRAGESRLARPCGKLVS